MFIFVLLLKEKYILHIFCCSISFQHFQFIQAYKNGLYGRKYQWLIVGLYGEKWWHTKDSSVDCTEEQLLTALDGYIMTDVLPLSSSKEKTETGIVIIFFFLTFIYSKKMIK